MATDTSPGQTNRCYHPRRHPGDRQQRHRRRSQGPRRHRRRYHCLQRHRTSLYPASGKQKCCDCNVNNLLIYDFKKSLECIKKLICAKCFSSAQEYNLKYSFKYILEYCTRAYGLGLQCRPNECIFGSGKTPGGRDLG